MMGLSDSERISMIRSAVLIQYTRVTDRRTDGRTDGINGVAYTRYSIYAVARNKITVCLSVCVCVCVRARTYGFWGRISRKRLEIEPWY